MENWGPYLMVPSTCRKNDKKVLLCESLDYDLLRQELITRGLPLEVVRVNNPWLYRRKSTQIWSMIGESDDAENDFPVEWDVSRLDPGTYEVTGLMQVSLEDGVQETVFTALPSIKEVRVG